MTEKDKTLINNLSVSSDKQVTYLTVIRQTREKKTTIITCQFQVTNK